MLGIHLDDAIRRNLWRRLDDSPRTLLATDLDLHLDEHQKTSHHPDEQQEISLRRDDQSATNHPVAIVLCEMTRHLVVLFAMIPLVVTVTIVHQLEMTLAVEMIVPVDRAIRVPLVVFAVCHPVLIVGPVDGILLVVKVRRRLGGQDGIVPLLDDGIILIQKIAGVKV
jgi:hypothetical protein